MNQTFIIQGRLPGLNDYTNANRNNRYGGAKLKKAAQQTVCWAIKDARLQPIAKPFYLHCTWVEPNMRRDKDNIAFAKKFILDALQEMAVIENDGWKEVIGFADYFRVDKKEPRIIVEIEEITK